MEGLSTGVPITLVVKAPNQKVGDQTIECFLDWTVKRLKTHLSSVYPNKPTEKNQRIIYSGKLLQDNIVLKDVLRQHDDTRQHTVHLVCSLTADDVSSNYSSNPAERNSTRSSSSESNSSTPSSRRSSTTTTSPNNNNDGVRHRMNSGVNYPNYYQQYGYTNYPMQYGQQPQQQGYMPNVQQAYWMQQMYAQQMAQYMQYSMQHSATASMLHTNVPPPAAPPAVPQPAPNLAAPQGPVNQAAPAPPPAPNPAAPANQNIRMNAGVGAAVDDDEQEGGNRDWLDWIYTFCRMGVLLSIVYFYSSLNRFIIVISAMVFIYLYQGGWFAIQRGRPGVREAQEAVAGDQQPQDQDGEDNQPGEDVTDSNQEDADDNQEDGETDEVTDGEEANAEPAVPEAPPRPGVIATAWIFVSTFFTSLLPLDPAANNNMAN